MQHIRHGIGTVRPYLYGAPALAEWLKRTFDAREIERVPGDGGDHVELELGDSVVVLETGGAPAEFATIASVYVYVNDLDATYKRAIETGAVSLSAPEDKPYDERAAGVKDSSGNTWWIATYTGARAKVNRLVTE
jgi:PhnB protein